MILGILFILLTIASAVYLTVWFCILAGPMNTIALVCLLWWILVVNNVVKYYKRDDK